MYQIQCIVEGVAPMLFNRMVGDAKGTGGKISREEEEALAKQRAYRNDAGLYVPSYVVKACLLRGIFLANLKEGRKSLGPYVEATAFIEPREISLGKQEPDFYHAAFVNIPPGKKGSKVWKIWPAVDIGWQLSFTLNITDNHRDPEQLRKGMEAAGLLCGLCDWRPEYGRFIVKEWDVKKT